MLRTNDASWHIELVKGTVLVHVKKHRAWPQLLPILNASPAPVHIIEADFVPCVFDVTTARKMVFSHDDIKFPEDLHSAVSCLTLRQCNLANADRLCDLVHLTKLTVSYCGITALPQDLWHLTKLERLNLSMNPIVAVPESYANFTTLKCVKLICNLLEEFPQQFRNCPGVEIELAGNPCYEKAQRKSEQEKRRRFEQEKAAKKQRTKQ